MDRVALLWQRSDFAKSPKQLSERLLLDVEAGICERASRIEEGITAVQTFVQIARLWGEIPPEFIAFWDGRFATFRTWQACVRRTLYRENWIEWDELEKARRTEAFRLLEDQLRRATLTIPVPGGLEYWDVDRPTMHPGLKLLQAREPSALRQLYGLREGLNPLDTPERSAQRSWLAPIESKTPIDRGGDGGDNGPGPSDDVPRAASHDNPMAVRRSDAGTHAVAMRLLSTKSGKLPLWIEAAIRLGVRFVRVAAAGVPPAKDLFEPRPSAKGDPCCKVCGCVHEAVVDEYYFWLFDTRWYGTSDDASPSDVSLNLIKQDADWDGWHDPLSLPRLLLWPSNPMVHLMWCRVHDGEIMQPRRSVEGVRLMDDGTAPGDAELVFDGRMADSLFFEVKGGVAPPGYTGAEPPGFRYDLAADDAVVVPLPPPTRSVVPLRSGKGLSAYRFFAYFAPGAPLFPLAPFAEATAVAAALRTHCRFEAALKWYALAYDPLQRDDRWCPGPQSEPPTDQPPVVDTPSLSAGSMRNDAVCCRHFGVPDAVAHARAITLNYLETLLAWGD